MNAVILVPRREDNGPRDRLWQWTRRWWEREQSHMPIIEGHHTEGLFSRSAAINLAARIAGDWEVAVIIDSDVICNPEVVKEAVELARETGKMVLPHTVRNDLDKRGSSKAMNGYTGSWEPFVQHRYSVDNGHPSVSSVVVVPRSLWDTIGGFDESFRGWGYEDTAFAAAAETFAGIIRMPGVVWHLWHPTATEGRRGSTTHAINAAKGQRYRAAIGQPDLIRRLQAEGRVSIEPEWRTTIPRILHRVVPEKTTPQVEAWWSRFEELHPGWQLMTHRDPLAPKDWPETSPYWGQVRNGAQLADLIRLEALLRWGGVYVDSDCEPLRSFEPLMSVPAFAAWEDERCVPNAVLGAVAQHPAIRQCLELAIERLPEGTWPAGPGVTTDVLPGRPDVLLLPPQAFYGVHYRDADRDALMDVYTPTGNPWAFVLHHYAYSWKGSE